MTTTIMQRVGDRMVLVLEHLFGVFLACGRLIYLTVSRLVLVIIGAAVGGFLLWAFGMLIYSFAGAAGLIAELVVNVFLPDRWELDGLLRLAFPIGFGVIWAGSVISESEFRRTVRDEGWHEAFGNLRESVSDLTEPWREATARSSLDGSAAYGVNQAGRMVRRLDLLRLESEREDCEREAREAARRALVPSRYVRPAVDLPTQFGIEPFLGWRGWWVQIEEQTGDLFLHAVGVGYQWPGRQVEAECHGWGGRERAHRAPDPNCTCGVYAVKERQRLGYPPDGIWAQGRVRLWGTVIETTKGFRAGIARIEGPVELILACEGDEDGSCARPVEVAVVHPVGFDLYCDAHRPVGSLRDELPIDEFVGRAAEQLQERYGVPFVMKGR